MFYLLLFLIIIYVSNEAFNELLSRKEYIPVIEFECIFFLFHLELEEALKVSEEFGVSCHRDSSFIFSLLYNCQ